MKLLEIINIRNFLAKLELSKFDKETRQVVRKNYVTASKYVKDFEEVQRTLRDKCFEGIDEEIKQKAAALEQAYETATDERKQGLEKELLSEEFASYQQAKKEFIELIEEELKREFEGIEWAKADEDALLDSLAAAELKFNAALADELKFMIKSEEE